MQKQRPFCLSIAGFDPCGGAGSLADVKTFEQLEVYGLGVTSAITFQNDNTFEGLQWCVFETIENQIAPLQKYSVKAVKIGLIDSLEVLEKTIKCIDTYFDKPIIVWDPVLKATAGFDFHESVKLNKYLAKRITLITPNRPEYEKLETNGFEDISILLKGGHAQNRGTDILKTNGKEIEITGEPFEKKIDKHGTGCVLSSAITAYLAKNFTLEEACRKAKKYIEKFILSNTSNLGFHNILI